MNNGKRIKKTKGKNTIKVYINIICIITMLYCGYRIINWEFENEENDKIQQNIIQAVTYNKEEEKYEVDLKELQKTNNETVAWIKVNNTNIEYPVVKGQDNSYYLTHNFEKNQNSSGWVFADYRNKFDGTDKNIIFYGHNRRDDSIFGTLKNVLTQQWYEDEKNHKIIVITEQGREEYQVFSVYKILAENYYIKTEFSEQSYSQYLKDMKERSKFHFNTELKQDSQVLTLSTCDNNNKYRVVLHAIK